MAFLSRLTNSLKALGQLGPAPLALYGLYRFGLWSGHTRRVTSRPLPVGDWTLRPVLPLPEREVVLRVLGSDGAAELLAEADQIAAGKVRIFGAEPVDLRLACEGPLQDWTAYERRPALLASFYTSTPDIKFLWEPARFGWAFTLGRAYHVSGHEQYAEAFWRYAEQFLDANPPCRGPHWMSAQEVAVRLMAFVWAGGVFAGAHASTSARMSRLARAVAAHAARIPPTLVYARSQNNNHLLSEAAGLLTAGLALPDHPAASRWCILGAKWLEAGLRSQIDGYGEYAQHSSNYHRLMLQLALWSRALIDVEGNPGFSPSLAARKKLAAASHWALALLDPLSGRTPNLGANDGAYLFPLSNCPFADFRPVAHAAAGAFLNYRLPAGPWDEMALWFGIPLDSSKTLDLPRYVGDSLAGGDSWATLRAVALTSRPSHADQLHFDLWWRGLNVARDAGTGFYNAPAPWDNPLTSTLVHNTVSVDGREQMTRAGRFLYVDWADGYYQTILATDEQVLQQARAFHYGYWRRGIRHARQVTVFADGRWLVEDELAFVRWLPGARREREFRLHWLLPDWEWNLVNGEERMENSEERIEIGLESPHGKIGLTIRVNPPYPIPNSPFSISNSPFSIPNSPVTIVRAGEYLHGTGDPDPVRGWVSPTYGIKEPALSLAVTIRSAEDVKFTSEFRFLQ